MGYDVYCHQNISGIFPSATKQSARMCPQCLSKVQHSAERFNVIYFIIHKAGHRFLCQPAAATVSKQPYTPPHGQ